MNISLEVSNGQYRKLSSRLPLMPAHYWSWGARVSTHAGAVVEGLGALALLAQGHVQAWVLQPELLELPLPRDMVQQAPAQPGGCLGREPDQPNPELLRGPPFG